MKEFSVSFALADRCLKLQLPQPIQIEERFLPFITERETADATVTFLETEKLEIPEGQPVLLGQSHEVYRGKDGYFRLYCDRQHGIQPYALVQWEGDTNNLTVRYEKGANGGVASAKACFFYIPLDDLLIRLDRLLIHASLVETQHGGILFCGPSGIGKSTQAQLWNTHEESRIVNGDRPILGRVDGKWLAYGSPYAGSSCYYVNARVPLRAIIMLQQGPACEIRKLAMAESFRSLYANAVMAPWNPENMEHICDMLQALAAEIPVYHLVCTPDQQAVETVKAALNKEANC